MRIIGNDPSVPRQTQEVASGTLPNGKPVVVNANGTVSVVSSSSASQALGSPATYGPATTRDAVFDSTNNKVAILYSDRDNSSRPTVVIGTVTSGNAISFGTPVAVDTNQSDFQTIAFDSTNGKVVVAYASYESYAVPKVRDVNGTLVPTEAIQNLTVGYPEVGDIVLYDTIYYEIDNVKEPQWIGGSPEIFDKTTNEFESTNNTLIASAHMVRKSQIQIDDRTV